MRRGVNALLFTAALASAGCVTDTGKLEIRPIADPYSQATKAGNPAVAEGRGLLAAGSVGLAIEAFRKALREQPDSIEALAGLAECYDQMGRHDLSRAKYESALAIAPNNTTLLRTFAASLERQGRHAEAIALRAEASETERTEAAALARLAPAAPLMVPAQPQSAPAAIAVVPKPHAPVQIANVAPKASAPIKIAQAKPKPAPALLQPALLEPEPPAPIRIADAQVRLTSAPVVGKTEWRIEAPTLAPLPIPSASVTVKLPPAPAEPHKLAATSRPSEPATVVAEVRAVAEPSKAAVINPSPVKTATVVAVAPRVEPATVAPVAPRPAEAPKAVASSLPRVEMPKVAIAGPSVTVKLPPVRPAAVMPAQEPAAPERRTIVEATMEKSGPRLERVSLAEVALVTDPRPRLRTEAVRHTTVGSTPRFVSLAQRNSGIRLLNAARREGLAARTRLALNRQGWNRVTIGDYARVRQKSLVLYSTATEQAARRIAAKYGIWIAKEARPGPLTILLGRDWVTRRQPSA